MNFDMYKLTEEYRRRLQQAVSSLSACLQKLRGLAVYKGDPAWEFYVAIPDFDDTVEALEEMETFLEDAFQESDPKKR